MDSAIASEHRRVLDGLKEFNDSTTLPLEEAHADLFSDPRKMYDPSGRYTAKTLELKRAVRMGAAKAGYYTMLAPKALGGEDLGPLMTFHTWEWLHSTYGCAHWLPFESVAHWAFGPGPLLLGLADSVRAPVAPQMMSGEKTACFGMSEPDAGSDAWMMRTRAVRDGARWTINGSKQWISNGPYADFAFIFAVTDLQSAEQRKGGITCFFVETGTPGFSVDGIIKLYGEVGGNEAILSFNDLSVPADRMVGKLGDGFRLALASVNHGRLYNTARCVGLAKWANGQAIGYSKRRVTFGQPISEHQGVSFMLADSAVDIYAARHMGLHYANLLQTGGAAIKEAAMAKLFATEMCVRVYDRAMQVMGGLGLANETHLYRGWHASRSVRIADGASEILRRTIAQRLLRGDVDL